MDWKFENIVVGAKALFSKMIHYGRYWPSKEYTLVELELQGKELCKEDSNEDIQCFMKEPDESMRSCDDSSATAASLVNVLTFAVIFQQWATFFTKQGMAMKRNIGSEFKIPPAALQSAITVASTYFDKKEEWDHIFQIMGIGMFLSVVAMVVAAVTENRKLEASKNRETESKTAIYHFLAASSVYIVGNI